MWFRIIFSILVTRPAGQGEKTICNSRVVVLLFPDVFESWAMFWTPGVNMRGKTKKHLYYICRCGEQQAQVGSVYISISYATCMGKVTPLQDIIKCQSNSKLHTQKDLSKTLIFCHNPLHQETSSGIGIVPFQHPRIKYRCVVISLKTWVFANVGHGPRITQGFYSSLLSPGMQQVQVLMEFIPAPAPTMQT